MVAKEINCKSSVTMETRMTREYSEKNGICIGFAVFFIVLLSDLSSRRRSLMPPGLCQLLYLIIPEQEQPKRLRLQMIPVPEGNGRLQ